MASSTLNYHKKSQKLDENLINRFRMLYGPSLVHIKGDRKTPHSPPRYQITESSQRLPKTTKCSSFPFLNPRSLDPFAPSTYAESSHDLPWLQPQIQDFDLYRPGSESSGTQSGEVVAQSSSGNRLSSDSDSVQSIAPSWNCIDPFESNNSSSSPTQLSHNVIDYAPFNSHVNPVDVDDKISLSPRTAVKQEFQELPLFKSGDSPLDAERLRYQTILRAPTAIFDSENEVPVTYLDKNRIYYLTIEDSSLPAASFETVQFRTCVRVSFDNEDHRRNASTRWKLWKDIQEISKSKGEDLPSTAVQFAGPNHLQMSVEQTNLDGFSVIWTTFPRCVRRCSIPVRFNFLSTDFTLAKGVKGDLVRVCVKTELVSDPTIKHEPEVSFCRVKLFRDSGAERKMVNDAARVRRKMEKLGLQAVNPDFDKPLRKRKRGSIHTENFADMSSHCIGQELSVGYQPGNSTYCAKRLAALRSILYSSAPETVFRLRADPRDDPDLHSSPPIDLTQNQTASIVDENASQKTEHLDPLESNFTPKDDHNFSKSEQPVVPTACFFVKLPGKSLVPSTLYRAIYLKARTLLEFKKSLSRIGFAIGIDSCHIIHINKAGLKIVVDDNFVRHIEEGQDMVVEIQKANCRLGRTGDPDTWMDIVLKY